jgi:hypothetical protein
MESESSTAGEKWKLRSGATGGGRGSDGRVVSSAADIC